MEELEVGPGSMQWSPLAHAIGVEVVDIGDEQATLSVDVRPDNRNRFGHLHGGAVATLIDAAGGVAALYGDDRGMRRSSTVSMTVQFLDIAEGRVEARAEVIRRGGRLTVCEVKVRDARAVLVATGLVTLRIDSGS
jgi:uncharacterized protein (TIGR00369 family)